MSVMGGQRQVPTWALVAAGAAPSVLLTSSIFARLATTSPYDSIGQTMSVLASTGRHGGWIMTAGFVLSALAQIVTAAGLYVLGPLPRITLRTRA